MEYSSEAEKNYKEVLATVEALKKKTALTEADVEAEK